VPAVTPRYPSHRLPQLNIRLPVDLHHELEAAVQALHRSRTRIVLDALSDYFERLPAKARRRMRVVQRVLEQDQR
jgi:KaiC/GvpD/RAD55 family RecA-like ATPase